MRKANGGDDERETSAERGSGRGRRSNYSPGMVPRVYYKEGGNYARDNIKEFDYKGNFWDI